MTKPIRLIGTTDIRLSAARVQRLSELATSLRRLVEASKQMPNIAPGGSLASHRAVDAQLDVLDALVSAEETRVTVETITSEIAVRRRAGRAEAA